MLNNIISKRLSKDKLYRAIYEVMDEIFEYRKEFKQKYQEKAGMAGKKEIRIKKIKIPVPSSS